MTPDDQTFLLSSFEDDVRTARLSMHVESWAGMRLQHPTRIRITASYRIGRQEKWCIEVKQFKFAQSKG